MFVSFRVQQLAELKFTGTRKEDLPGRPDPDIFQGQQSPLLNGSNRTKEWMDEARQDYETLSREDKTFWEEQERKHDERHPEVLAILESTLAKNPRRSAKKLSEDIGYWCGKTTIGKWKCLKVGPTYRKSTSTGKSSSSVPDTAVSSIHASVSLPYANSEEEDTITEYEEDDCTFEDGTDISGADNVDEEDMDDVIEEDQVNSVKEEPALAEEKKQFLASIAVASAHKKGPAVLPTRISATTSMYVDNHVSSLVVTSSKPDIAVALKEVNLDEEHLLI
jgi:hypothetical protein